MINQSNNFPQEFEVKDHSVSNETFKLVLDKEYGFYRTTPQPSKENLQRYYKSADYISHTDKKETLLERTYQYIRSVTLKKKLRIINSLNQREKNLLDIGCGTGDFLKTASTDGWKVTGIEPDEGARKIAIEKNNNRVFDADKLWAFEMNSFDVITLWHVLEHLPNLEDHIALFKKILKPEGVIIVAVPNHQSFDANHYKNHWAAFDVPRHLWHFSQDSIQKLFCNEKFVLKQTLPMKFDSFYVSLLSEKIKYGWMNPFKAFLIGLASNLKASRNGQYSSLIYILNKA